MKVRGPSMAGLPGLMWPPRSPLSLGSHASKKEIRQIRIRKKETTKDKQQQDDEDGAAAAAAKWWGKKRFLSMCLVYVSG